MFRQVIPHLLSRFSLPRQRLAEWVAVQSVSAWPEKRGEIKKMMEMAAKDIERLGGSVEMVDIGKQKLPSGEEIPLPPIVLGRLGSDPGKKTLCIYGHLDVQPANLDDGWDTEPFTLVEKDGEGFVFWEVGGKLRLANLTHSCIHTHTCVYVRDKLSNIFHPIVPQLDACPVEGL